VGKPVDPVAEQGWPLTGCPCLVRVDRYGSVSGLLRVRVLLGWLVIVTPEEVSIGS
jgi:hypothetical protein